jgi:hypothetical protein
VSLLRDASRNKDARKDIETVLAEIAQRKLDESNLGERSRRKAILMKLPKTIRKQKRHAIFPKLRTQPVFLADCA